MEKRKESIADINNKRLLKYFTHRKIDFGILWPECTHNTESRRGTVLYLPLPPMQALHTAGLPINPC